FLPSSPLVSRDLWAAVVCVCCVCVCCVPVNTRAQGIFGTAVATMVCMITHAFAAFSFSFSFFFSFFAHMVFVGLRWAGVGVVCGAGSLHRLNERTNRTGHVVHGGVCALHEQLRAHW